MALKDHGHTTTTRKLHSYTDIGKIVFCTITTRGYLFILYLIVVAKPTTGDGTKEPVNKNAR